MDLVGEKFNRLTVIGSIDKEKGKAQKYICKCDCGNIIETPTKYKLKSGTTNSIIDMAVEGLGFVIDG